ncbi:MAG: hypothetical protein QMD36_03870 [Candidatus Aenigmarchaeota archaeon]|nr:hypothetical protein [Candidatus Aenigmarchaeota archaeon]
MRELIQHHKIVIYLVLIGICLVPTVYALGLSPLELNIQVEKGKETEVVQNIQVSNPSENPIHIVGSVSGSVAQFITLDPQEFDLPAGPGLKSPDPRPYQYVTVTFKIPREVPETKYTGEILFTQQPVAGGMIGTAAQLGVAVRLTIGTMAAAEFPVYVNAMLAILILSLIISIIFYKRGKE